MFIRCYIKLEKSLRAMGTGVVVAVIEYLWMGLCPRVRISVSLCVIESSIEHMNRKCNISGWGLVSSMCITLVIVMKTWCIFGFAG